MGKRLTEKEVLGRVHAKYGDRYDILTHYTKTKDRIMAHCNACGQDFATTPARLLYSHHGCPTCASRSQTSFLEQFLLKLCRDYFGEDRVLSRNHDLTDFELDIVVLDKSNNPFLAIEPGGWRWHNVPDRIDRDQEKYLACRSKHIDLLTIYDGDSSHEACANSHVWSYEYSFSDANEEHLKDLVERINIFFGISLDCSDIESAIHDAYFDMNSYSLETVRETLHKSNMKLHSDCVGNMHQHIEVECEICGHIWHPRMDSVLEGLRGCPQCGKKRGQLKQSKAVRNVDTGVIYSGVREAGRLTGLHPSKISACCKGVQHTTGGYHWEYVKAAA